MKTDLIGSAALVEKEPLRSRYSILITLLLPGQPSSGSSYLPNNKDTSQALVETIVSGSNIQQPAVGIGMGGRESRMREGRSTSVKGRDSRRIGEGVNYSGCKR